MENTFTEQKISSLWKPKPSRGARHYDDKEDLDFPSNEGALMTISFLTFALLLIKLVLVRPGSKIVIGQ